MVMGAHAARFVCAPTSPQTDNRKRRGIRKLYTSSRRRETILLSEYNNNNSITTVDAIIIKLYLLLLMLLLLLSSGSAIAQSSPASNAQALLLFKTSLANADTALADWKPATNPCPTNQPSWRGVICAEGENVWGLQLENMNLSGNIDVDSLLALPLLRTLSFMKNQFEGPIPEFNKLGALKSLYLSNNKFSGPIADDSFEGMASLKKLHLANNQFTGNIPSSIASPRLLEAKLENNQFEGRIPDFPPGLKVLDVSNNKLEGPIPQSVSKIDPAAFKGNKNLCGPPLDTECPAADAPITGVPGKSSMSAWKIIVIVMACVIVLAVVVLLYIVYHQRNKDKTPRLGRTLSSPMQGSGVTGADAAAAADGNVAAVEMAPAAAGRVRKTDQQQHGKLSFVREDRQRFELQDLLRASAEVLGSGSFGSSYKAVLMDGQSVVVKRFKQMSSVGREEFHEHMRRLGRLNHPNLLPLVAYYYRKEEKLLVFDYVHYGSLAGQLHGKHSAENPGLDWPTRLNIIKGVAKGLAYLYNELPSLIVPHGHLKSSNVLLDKSYQPLLMDYTLVPVVNMSQAPQLLLAYKSPEYSQHGRTTKKTDVWSLGILILEVLTGQFPANYLLTPKGDLANWVNSIATDVINNNTSKVFDQDMGATENAGGEMVKLLKIGINCSESDLDKRLDLNEAVEKIESLKVRDK